MKYIVSGITDVGKSRDHNEDNFSIITRIKPFSGWEISETPKELSENGALFVVADGMGGANAGEVASAIAVDSIMDYIQNNEEKLPSKENQIRDFLFSLIEDIHVKLIDHAKSHIECKGMGTTIVISFIINNKAFIAWVGDSRCYHKAKDLDIRIITEDHSLVWELHKQGKLTEAEAERHPDSNIITQSLSDSPAIITPGYIEHSLYEGDKLLLCSDGLNGMIYKDEIQTIINENTGQAACRTLIDAANREGGHDNITAILLEIKEGEELPIKTNDDNKEIEVDSEAEDSTNETIKTERVSADSKPERKDFLKYTIIGFILIALILLIIQNSGSNKDNLDQLNTTNDNVIQLNEDSLKLNTEVKLDTLLNSNSRKKENINKDSL